MMTAVLQFYFPVEEKVVREFILVRTSELVNVTVNPEIAGLSARISLVARCRKPWLAVNELHHWVPLGVTWA